MTALWRAPGRVEIVREEPRLTRGGKVLPLALAERDQPSAASPSSRRARRHRTRRCPRSGSSRPCREPRRRACLRSAASSAWATARWNGRSHRGLERRRCPRPQGTAGVLPRSSGRGPPPVDVLVAVEERAHCDAEQIGVIRCPVFVHRKDERRDLGKDVGSAGEKREAIAVAPRSRSKSAKSRTRHPRARLREPAHVSSTRRWRRP